MTDDDRPHYRRTNGAMADCKTCGGEGWIDCSEIGQPDVRCLCVSEAAAEPAPTHRARSVIGRVVLWGLYRRAVDGDFVYESWLWGAFKRCRLSPIKFMRARSVVVVRPPELSVGDRAAFGAIGGTLNTPEDHREWAASSLVKQAIERSAAAGAAARVEEESRRPRRTTEPGSGTKRRG